MVLFPREMLGWFDFDTREMSRWYGFDTREKWYSLVLSLVRCHDGMVLGFLVRR